MPPTRALEWKLCSTTCSRPPGVTLRPSTTRWRRRWMRMPLNWFTRASCPKSHSSASAITVSIWMTWIQLTRSSCRRTGRSATAINIIRARRRSSFVCTMVLATTNSNRCGDRRESPSAGCWSLNTTTVSPLPGLIRCFIRNCHPVVRSVSVFKIKLKILRRTDSICSSSCSASSSSTISSPLPPLKVFTRSILFHYEIVVEIYSFWLFGVVGAGPNRTGIPCCGVDDAAKHPECFDLFMKSNDPFYKFKGVDCTDFVRSAPAPACSLGNVTLRTIRNISAYIQLQNQYTTNKS